MPVSIGLPEVDRKLAALADRDAKKIVRKAVGAGQTVLAKALRQQVDSASGMSPALKRALKKTVGKKFRAKAKGNQRVGARVGFAVGKKQPRPGARTRPGVGISARNVHWPLLGTAPRRTGAVTRRTKTGVTTRATGKAARDTGAMPGHRGLAAAAAAGASDDVLAALERVSREAIESLLARFPGGGS